MSVARRTQFFIGAVTLLVAVAVFPTGLTAHHAWGKYHWSRATNPLALDVGDNLSGAWSPGSSSGSYLDIAIADWNASSVLDLRPVSSNVNPSSCPPTLGRIEVCNFNSGDTGWLGIAQIWTSGRSHIVQATARMNDFYFNDPPYNTDAWRQLVICQEVAHDFGLDHQDENFNNPNLGTCMDYTADPEGPPSNLHPNQHDYEQLESIYSHLDGSGAGGGGGGGRGRGGVPPGIFPLPPQGVARGLSNNPAQWGTLIRSNGRAALYDLDLGNDNHVFTFVIRP